MAPGNTASSATVEQALSSRETGSLSPSIFCSHSSSVSTLRRSTSGSLPSNAVNAPLRQSLALPSRMMHSVWHTKNPCHPCGPDA